MQISGNHSSRLHAMERIVTERLHAGYSGWTKVVVRGDVRIISLRFFSSGSFCEETESFRD